MSISIYDFLSQANSNHLGKIANSLRLLGNDDKQMNTTLDRMWKQFGHFSKDSSSVRIKKIMQELSEAINVLNKECLRNETCWSIVEKGARSIVALVSLGQNPNAGSYLSHHMSRMFSSKSYIPPSTYWPYYPFNKDNSDELTLDLNQYLMSMTYELSNANLKNVSILDLPSFGSRVEPTFRKSCYKNSWTIQQNMAIYSQLMSSNNYTWSKDWRWDISEECNDLKEQ